LLERDGCQLFSAGNRKGDVDRGRDNVAKFRADGQRRQSRLNTHFVNTVSIHQ
jgi:hypothetical protein